MVATTSYVTPEELRNFGGIHDGNDPEILVAIRSASRAIDNHCHRRFWRDDAATTRLYHPLTSGIVHIDDASYVTAAADIAVGVDETNTGVAVSWATTEWIVEPLNGIGPSGEPGWPATKLTGVGTHYFVTGYNRPLVHVTARWGWVAVPDPVRQACLLLAHRLFKRRESPHGIGGFNDFVGVVRVLANEPDLAMLLDPYVTASVGEYV